MRSLALLPCMLSIAHADAVREPLLPERVTGIAASAAGALVVDGSPNLVALEPTGARSVSHPDVGELIAVTDGWVLGKTGVLHRSEAGWQRIALPALANPLELQYPSHVTAIAADRAVAVRVAGGSSVVDVVDAAGTSTALATFDHVVLSRPVADGRGGFWVIVHGYSPHDYAGYAHVADGRWTLFRQQSSRVGELPMETRPAGEHALLDALAYTGDGGVLARWGNRLFRITADGSIAVLADVPTYGSACAILPDGAGGYVAVSTNHDQLETARISAGGVARRESEIRPPGWFVEARQRLFSCDAALAGDRLWVASTPFVFERSQQTGAVTLRVATSVVEGMEYGNEVRNGHPIAANAPTAVALAIGVFGGAELGDTDYKATSFETIAGTVGGIPGALLLDAVVQSECGGKDSDYRTYNELACAGRWFGYALGVVGGGALSGLATYEMGKQFDDIADAKLAYGGAAVGAMAGAVVGIFATKLVNSLSPRAGMFTRSLLGAALMGAGATLGFQLRRTATP